ncbi:MAG TPA: NUDIX domain-containing protein [Streptosporangiaceae bacterium]|nr:NUDIX domain-containing protein [Streptosporangiaceae bacterium]
MTADGRLVAARAFLASSRGHKLAERPHSVLVREAAELRRQLGIVLDVIDEGVPAAAGTAAQVLAWKSTLRQALIDAIRWREERPGEASTADQIALYATVARSLGIDLGPVPRTYTHPDVLTIGVLQGWAEAETDPTRIDWPARQAAAAIPFEVVDGRPVNPCASTGIRHGRNELGRWGEQLMADALVTVTIGGQRYLLMVERGDGYGWAVPGGSAEPGETGLQAAVRELVEETGLAVPLAACRPQAPLYVPDPRASDEAWAVTVPVHIDLGHLGGLPSVNGADDARRAEWVRADHYGHLVAWLGQVYGGRVFAAHVAMLEQFLGQGGVS